MSLVDPEALEQVTEDSLTFFLPSFVNSQVYRRGWSGSTAVKFRVILCILDGFVTWSLVVSGVELASQQLVGFNCVCLFPTPCMGVKLVA